MIPETSSALYSLLPVGIGLLALSLTAVFMYTSFFKRNKLKGKFEAQRSRFEQYMRLLQSNLLSQDKEREQIAHDIHDEIGARLTIMHLYLHQLGKKNPQAQDTITDLLGIVQETLHNTRRISNTLLPPSLEKFGLEAAIREYCEQIDESGRAAIYFQAEGTRPAEATKNIEVHLFRIVTDLLSLSIHQAEATQIEVQLWQQPNGIILYFQTDRTTSEAPLPLLNIENRLHMINGTFDLKHPPGGGLQAKVEVILVPELNPIFS